MDSLPDELIQRILDSFVQSPSSDDPHTLELNQTIAIQNPHYDVHNSTIYKVNVAQPSQRGLIKDNDKNSLSHSLYSISLVNRRIRRVSLPLLFESVDFLLYPMKSEDEEINRFRFLLERIAPMTHLIRKVRIFPYDRCAQAITKKYHHFVEDLLSTCSKLQCLYLRLATKETKWSSLFPIINTVNSYPSPDFRLVFPSTFGSPEDFSSPQSSSASDDVPVPSTSLSRVVCWRHDPGRTMHGNYVDTLITKLGLHVVEVNTPAPGWHKKTYPGLTSMTSCPSSDLMTPQEFTDFMSRHPLLRRVSLKDFPLDKIPWGMTIQEELKPHTCTFSSRRSKFFAFRHDWNDTWERQLIQTKLSLKADPVHGFADLIVKLTKALPHVAMLELNFDAEDVRNCDIKSIPALFMNKFQHLQYLAFTRSRVTLSCSRMALGKRSIVGFKFDR
ncbi:hypothetical protein K435DRAFT_967206 [Dendrothele bispora CBS 962.96]|uniref:Uncharacterized protein n=1 Tax=Dendrothele bispora (strain CBS 962.96) TaxID=1314807 RepID=A0A4S8LVI0_DENBC|nr:hypothetical protein K435DRAFT_967206 [Dendrothele bispora CBS 962.96]